MTTPSDGKKEELLPCPFCGGEGILSKRSIGRWWHVECERCHARTMVCGKGKGGVNKKSCIDRWNTRKFSPAQDKVDLAKENGVLREALNNLKDCINNPDFPKMSDKLQSNIMFTAINEALKLGEGKG